jgi:hypothetical protein
MNALDNVVGDFLYGAVRDVNHLKTIYAFENAIAVGQLFTNAGKIRVVCRTSIFEPLVPDKGQSFRRNRKSHFAPFKRKDLLGRLHIRNNGNVGDLDAVVARKIKTRRCLGSPGNPKDDQIGFSQVSDPLTVVMS